MVVVVDQLVPTLPLAGVPLLRVAGLGADLRQASTPLSESESY